MRDSLKMILKGNSRALFSALISILLFHSVSSQSEIGGNITEDATLDILGSPYNVTSTLLISPNVTLTVDPGVELQFQPNTGVVVRGSLIANGTATNRVKFTRNPENISIPIGYDQIRLADGYYENEGRLEVFLNGQWGTVCEHNWGSPDTQVACRQLGYLSGYVSQYLWYDSGPIWLDDVECIGNEQVLWNCSHNGIGVHNCGYYDNVGLVCETYLIERTWAGLQWIQDINTTSQSVLSYTDVEYVGSGQPAISASGITPILNNVNVLNNFGDGVKFSKVSVETTVFNSRISQNGGNGLDVSTVGTGSIYVEGSEIAKNGEYGVKYDGNEYLEDPDYYRFCGYNRSLSDYIYLEHAKDDFIDTYECLQVFSTPPGTTVTAFILSGAGSPYTGITFWNGNTTDDILLSGSISPSNGEPIRTTTNSLTVMVYRTKSYDTTFFNLFIQAQRDSDYDLHLQDVYIHDNNGGINVQHTHQRLTVEASTITQNIYYGMRVWETYGDLSLLNTDLSHNKGEGLLVDSASGTTSVDKCYISNNTGISVSGISIRFASSSNKAYELSITNSTFELNEDIAVSIEPVNCNEHTCHFVMTSCAVHDHKYGGLEFNAGCNSFTDYDSTALISHNTFTNSGYIEFYGYISVIDVAYVPLLTMEGNRIENNTGNTIMTIVFPSTKITPSVLITIQNNTIVNNFADNIVHVIGQYSNGLDKGILKDNVVANNTAFVVFNIDILYPDSTDDFNITGNSLLSNIPRPYLDHMVSFLPVAVISSDTPDILVTGNILENPLFPLQLIMFGENFGTYVKADYNWWGTADESKIQQYIWDHLDRYAFPTVDYFPFLLSADLSDVINLNATRYIMPFIRDGVIGGVVQGNISLTDANRKYFVDRDIIISQSSALHISPDVVLSFSHFSAVFVQGKLIALGHADQKVTLEPHYNKSADDMRLVDGEYSWEGRLELLIDGDWHSMCTETYYWTEENARVACRQMGYFDVTYYNLRGSPGSGPRLNYPVQCYGNEARLLDCPPNEDAPSQCTSNSYDVNIECRSPQWTGLIFPANNEVSELRNVCIANAFYKYQYDKNTFHGTEAITVHLHHHEFHNLDIISPYVGMKFLYTDPCFSIRPMSSISIQDSSEYGSEFYSDGISIENWLISSSKSGIYTSSENQHSELIKYIDPSNKISTCFLNKTLTLEDIFLLSPPFSTSNLCNVYNVYEITNIDLNGRIGVFVLYSSYYTEITVEDQGKTILTVTGDTPHDNSVISNGSTITVRHQANDDLREMDYTFYLLVKGVDGDNQVPTRKHLDTFALKNISIKHDYSSFNIMEFTPTQWTEIVVSDTTIDCDDNTCIDFRHQFERLYLSNTHFSNGRYVVGGSAPLLGEIYKCSFYDMDNGLQSSASNMILEDTSFSFIKSEALTIGGSNWIVKNCTFDNTAYAVKVTSRCNTTIDGCNFFQTSQSAIYFASANIVNAFISDSIFKNNYGTVLDIEKASTDASLSVINNIFEANEATVLKIPNELPRCNVRNNTFLKNSALHVVEFFEAVTLSSAMSSNFEHVFNGNALIDNHPIESSNNKDQACTIITRLLAGKFQYNYFGNEDFLFEFCLGPFIFFDVNDSLDATFNNWNTTNDSQIDQKIFDINDRNDRPGVTFRPYLTAEKFEGTRSEQPPFGGKLLEDKTMTVSGSPYFVQSDITILDNVTLTIEPGVELLFEPNIGMLVLGSLVARGNSSNRITMNTDTNITWGDVRLKDGPSSRNGRLEIFFNEEWGTVCRDFWDLDNARVVCRQLGMGSPISYLNREFTGTPPDQIWLDNVFCTGDEAMLADCPSNGIGVHNCDHNYDVGLECEFESTNSWGGVRIIGNQESNTAESILEYVDIINTGYLHSKPAPGLYIRHASPRLDNINIMYSDSSGILADTPVSDFILHDVTIQHTVNGVVLYKTGNVMLDMDKINVSENEEAAVALHEEDDSFAFSMCYYNTIPICAPDSDSVIEVDKYADLLLQIPFKMYTESSNASCIVHIRPKRNEILVLQVYKADTDNNYVAIYEGDTSNLLGNISQDEQYLTVVSPESGGVLRVHTSYSPSFNLEVYFRVTTTDDVRMMKHSIRDSIFAENKNGGITVNTIPYGLQNSVSNMLPYDCHIYLDRCQIISNEASTSEYVLSMILQSGSVFEMENCKISENKRMGVLKLQLGDAQYRNKSLHRILNNEFSYNSFLKGMMFIEGPARNHVEWAHIYGNLFLSNQCYESESVIDINNIYFNFDTNIAVNNAAYRVLHINQDDIPDEPQECTNNLITNNLMQVINKLYTIEVGATGVEFRNNVLDNPINDYEISVTLGDGIINATYNWWGTTSSKLIAERLRDSDILIGIPDVPDVVFEPFLLSSPSHVQNDYCPMGYIEYEGDCFGYKGGAVDFDAAEQACKIDGSILPTMPSAILQNILQDRTQHSSSPNGIWLDYLTGNNSVDKDEVSWERSCFIMKLSESPDDNGVNETSCNDNQPYICTQSALPKPTTEGKTTTSPVTKPMSSTTKTTQAQSTTAESTEPKSTTAKSTPPKSSSVKPTQTTQPKSTSPNPTESKVCIDDDDCNGHGICEAGQCKCNSCIYTGKSCEIVGQCFECSMTIDSLYGEPAEFTDDLNDPESDAYKNATKILHPFIEKVISDTNTAADGFLFTEIAQFTSGSIKVDYTVTLEEGTMVSDEQLADEMNEALILHQDDPEVSVRNGSLSVSEHQEPVSDSLNMVIFTYVGCCIATFTITLTIVVYMLNKHLLKPLSSNLLLSFCVSLLGLYVSYTVLIATVESGDVDELLCNILAGIVHYFVLVTALWTVMEGIAMCLNYKNKLDGLEWCFFTTACVFAWGVPAIIVVVTSLITKQDYTQEDICFLKQVPMIASVIVPLAVIIILDGILFIYAAKVFVSHNDPEGDKAPVYDNCKTRLKNDHIVVLLLTLNCVLGYLALLPSTSYIAQPCFCFLSIIFGFTLFFLFIVRQPTIFLTSSSESLESSEMPDSSVNASGDKPDSVPMSQIEQNRPAKDSDEGYENNAFTVND